MQYNVTARPNAPRSPSSAHHPHEDELILYSDLTFSTAKMLLSHAICLKRHSEAFAAPEEARPSYDALLDTVFTDLLQWLPHRSVICERGECFYSDDTHAKALAITKVRGVTGNAVHSMKHQRIEAQGWKLVGVQFRGIFSKLNGHNFWCISFELRWLPNPRKHGDVRHHALVTYQIGEIGRKNQEGRKNQPDEPDQASASKKKAAAEPMPPPWKKEWW